MQTDLFIIRTPLQYAKRELLDWKIIFQTHAEQNLRFVIII